MARGPRLETTALTITRLVFHRVSRCGKMTKETEGTTKGRKGSQTHEVSLCEGESEEIISRPEEG